MGSNRIVADRRVSEEARSFGHFALDYCAAEVAVER